RFPARLACADRTKDDPTRHGAFGYFARDDGRPNAQRTTGDLRAWRAFHRARVPALTASPRAVLEGLFRTAGAAAHPHSSIPAHLPAPPARPPPISPPRQAPAPLAP